MTGKYQDWTIKEIKLLEKLYLHDKLKLTDLPPYFPNRTPIAIKRALGRFNLWRSELEFWLEHEIEFLVKNYAVLGCLECAKQLKRTKWMVKQQARRLKLRANYDFWSNEEIIILKQNYKIQPFVSILQLLQNKTLRQVTNKMMKLSLRRTDRKADKRPRWSNDEIKILKENYNALSKDNLLKLLPLRNYSQIKKKAQLMKLTKPHRH